MDLRLDLYTSAERGAYGLTVTAAPEGVASPGEIPERSADLVEGGTPAAPEARSVVLTFWTPSAVARSVANRPGCVLYAYFYSAPDAEAMAAFDRRITEEYTVFYAAQGMYYSGLMRAEGAGLPPLAELMAIEAGSAEEAQARLDQLDPVLPERIVAIEDECRALQDRASALSALADAAASAFAR
jgi:hypothetical protein